MIILFGSRFITWGSERTATLWYCPACEKDSHFVRKRGLRCIALFFLIPIFPLGRVEHFTQCPNCGARYAAPDAA